MQSALLLLIGHTSAPTLIERSLDLMSKELTEANAGLRKELVERQHTEMDLNVQDLKDFSHVGASDEWHFSGLHKGLDSTLSIVNNEIKYKAVIVKAYGDIPEVEYLAADKTSLNGRSMKPSDGWGYKKRSAILNGGRNVYGN